jgi:hypothetical protein
MDDGIGPLRVDGRERPFRRSRTSIELAARATGQRRPLALDMEVQNSGAVGGSPRRLRSARRDRQTANGF